MTHESRRLWASTAVPGPRRTVPKFAVCMGVAVGVLVALALVVLL